VQYPISEMAFSRGCLFACRADGWQAAMYMPYQTLEVSQDRADVRAAHSDVGPGPFIDWVRYSLWGRPCVVSQRSSGMHPRIQQHGACRQHHGDTRDVTDARWGLGTLLEAWESGLVRSSSVLPSQPWADHVRAAIIS